MVNNLITVNLSDFDVIEALANMDAVPTGSSPPGEYGQLVPPNPTSYVSPLSSIPQTTSSPSGAQPAPIALGIDAKTSKPPLLPPQLLQVRYYFVCFGVFSILYQSVFITKISRLNKATNFEVLRCWLTNFRLKLCS